LACYIRLDFTCPSGVAFVCKMMTEFFNNLTSDLENLVECGYRNKEAIEPGSVSQLVDVIAVQRSGNENFRVGVADMQGWRCAHEDSHFIGLNNCQGAFGVLDGHGGHKAAFEGSEMLKKKLLNCMAKCDRDLPANGTLEKAFQNVDESLRKQEVQEGSTVIGTVVQKSRAGEYTLKMLNCGDSRGILVRKDKHFLATKDHKPDVPEERRRIEASGGFVEAVEYRCGRQVMRLNGDLAVSRGLGDFRYKEDPTKKASQQKISCIPEIYEVSGVKQGDWCVLCCDGVFDVMSNSEVVKFISERVDKNDADLGDISAALIRKCLGRNSRDNMTVMIIQFVDGSASANFPDEIQNHSNFSLKCYKRNCQKQKNLQKAYGKFLASKGFGCPVRPCHACGRWHHELAKCPW